MDDRPRGNCEPVFIFKNGDLHICKFMNTSRLSGITHTDEVLRCRNVNWVMHELVHHFKTTVQISKCIHKSKVL